MFFRAVRLAGVPSAIALAASLLAAGPCPATAQDTLRFTPTVGYSTFAVREPVARIRPGTVLVSNTNHGPYYDVGGGTFPGEVGPFWVEGAEPGDMLVVEILKVRPNAPLAASQISSGLGSLSADPRTPMLNDPAPRRRYEWAIDREKMTGTIKLPDSQVKEMTIALNPMLGRVAVAPTGEEAFSNMWPGNFGGNMDAPEVREGTTVYLPVFHEGAYFYFGDGHAAQGHGELNGSGLETSMDGAFKIGLVKGKRIDWPRLEDADYIMVAGSARPLIDALRIAHVELVKWLETEYGFNRWDAYEMLGQLAQSTVANVVDPNYTVVAKFPKKYLPAKVAR
ncbi:MAG: acetamidase [Gemmatimonadetes bacterium]|nr:acetamidase [Gemmatimonadota bacterium]